MFVLHTKKAGPKKSAKRQQKKYTDIYTPPPPPPLTFGSFSYNLLTFWYFLYARYAFSSFLCFLAHFLILPHTFSILHIFYVVIWLYLADLMLISRKQKQKNLLKHIPQPVPFLLLSWNRSKTSLVFIVHTHTRNDPKNKQNKSLPSFKKPLMLLQFLMNSNGFFSASKVCFALR